MEKSEALDKADSLIRHLIEHQPSFVVAGNINAKSGENFAEFLAVLRLRLSDTFVKQAD